MRKKPARRKRPNSGRTGARNADCLPAKEFGGRFLFSFTGGGLPQTPCFLGRNASSPLPFRVAARPRQRLQISAMTSQDKGDWVVASNGKPASAWPPAALSRPTMGLTLMGRLQSRAIMQGEWSVTSLRARSNCVQ